MYLYIYIRRSYYPVLYGFLKAKIRIPINQPVYWNVTRAFIFRYQPLVFRCVLSDVILKNDMRNQVSKCLLMGRCLHAILPGDIVGVSGNGYTD